MKISFNCNNCGKAISTSSEHAGKKTKCPGCQAPIIIPQPEAEAPVEENILLTAEDSTEEKLAAPELPESPVVWYYADGSARKGPVTENALRQLIHSGSITGTTLLWKEGMADWLPFDKVMSGQTSPNIPPALPGQPATVVYCRCCGKTVRAQAVVCPSCGCAPQSGKEFCQHCGKPTAAMAIVCLSCGGALSSRQAENTATEKQMSSYFLCLFLGGLAIHRFYLKNENAVVMLLVSIFTLTIGGVIWACFDLVKIANGEYCDGDGVALGSPVSWMVVLAWVVVGIYALTGVSILLAGCAGCAAAL